MLSTCRYAPITKTHEIKIEHMPIEELTHKIENEHMPIETIENEHMPIEVRA